MLNDGRRQGIVDYVEDRDGATAESLAEAIGVSAATIRRDLARLHGESLVERLHEGTLRQSETSVFGALTEDALRSLRADKLFMGCPAVHQEHGF